MTEEASSRVTDDAGSNPGASTVRQRKKRKWDQPAESMISAGLSVPGMVPFAGSGALASTGLLGMVLPSVAMPSAFMSVPQVPSTVSAVQQNAAAIVQKINQDLVTKGLLSQSKIQDELIAREIVINDADPAVRYKLTKRQTQEEIQSITGAVVITRGRYRPPNGAIENEKPLYLHISAGVHLKDTAERIKAVDQAAVMVEEILKQGRQQQSASVPFSAVPASGGLGTPPLMATVFVGLDADPVLNIVSRIRGPNDQYINHIMNETGATVVLRGRGSGNHEGPLGEELQQPLQLFISTDNLKSLEDAKRLAENLLETVRSECFISRPSTHQVAAPGTNPATVMPSVSGQSSIPPYQASSYSVSTVSTGLYTGFYPSAAMSYPQTHALNSQSFPSANTHGLNSSLPQPGAVTTAALAAIDSCLNKLSTSKVYNAVPPPQQLLTESTVTKSDTEKTDVISAEASSSKADVTVATSSTSNSTLSTSCIAAQPNLASAGLQGTPGVVSNVVSSNGDTYASPSGLGFSYAQLIPAIYPQVPHTQQPQLPHVMAVSSGTCYSGYGGIYPQVTPLQQVALALQRPPPPVSIKPGSQHSTSTPLTKAQSSYPNGQSEKQPTQRRKFQEVPVAAKEPSKDDQASHQGTESSRPGYLSEEPSTKKLQSISLPKRLPMGPPKDMSPPPLKNMPQAQPVSVKSTPESKTEGISCHEANVRLVEYGEEDDDDLSAPQTVKANSTPYANGKPFWAP